MREPVRRAAALAWTLAAVLGAAACGWPTDAEGTRASFLAELAGPEWILVELDGSPIPAGAQAPTASFDADGVAGFGGCNRYRGSVHKTSPGAIEIGPLAGTRMACPPPAMDLERRFLAALGEAKRYALAGGRLSLLAGDPLAPRLVFVRREAPPPTGG